MNKKTAFKSIFSGVVAQKNSQKDDIKNNIIINQELEELIPPLHIQEFEQLEENILKEGIRESIKIWDNEDQYILIDGHNRFKIAKKHSLDFKIETLSFNSFQEAKDWMIHFQLGRRNLNPEQISYLRGILYNELKQEFGGNLKKPHLNETELKGQNVRLGQDTENGHSKKSEKLSKQYNVSEKTIRRDGQYAEGLNLIGKVNPELKSDLLTGKVKAKKTDIQTLLKADIGDLVLNSVEDISTQAKLVLKENTKKSIDKILNEKWYLNQLDESNTGKHLQFTNIKIDDVQFDFIQFIKTPIKNYLIGFVKNKQTSKIEEYVDYLIQLKTEEQIIDLDNLTNHFIIENNSIKMSSLQEGFSIVEKKKDLLELLLSDFL